MLHHTSTVADGIHIIQAWDVADETARLALSITAADIGKICFQQDTKALFALVDIVPTWKPLTLNTTDDLSEGGTNLYHTTARVLGQVLTGLSTAAGTVVNATHTVLQALGFLQKQISDLSITVGGNTGSINAINTTLTNKLKQIIPIAVSDETTAITAGVAKVTFRMPFAMTLAAVRASLTTGQTGGNIFTVDINEAGVSLLSTKLTIDNTEKSSTTAAVAPVISDANIADDAEITIDIDQIGDGTAKGLKVYLIGSIA